MYYLALILLAGVPAWAQVSTVPVEHLTPPAVIRLSVQSRDSAGRAIKSQVALDPARTAIVVVDIWDQHWCKTHAQRVAGLVPRMNQALEAARQLGIQVVFAPSEVVDFYRDTPQRRAMQAVPQHPAPTKKEFAAPAPPGPTDFCECGPDQPCKKGKPWTRQHPDLKIADGDLIGDCNNGQELLNLCAERRIETLIYMGVASNICVQYRSMGIRNMKSYGLRIIVVADLVEAITSNGLDALGRKNLDFTPAGGTARVQRYIEQYLASTIESGQLLTTASLDSHPQDKRPHIVLVAAEREYDSQKTLAAFARDHLAKDYRCTLLAATGPEGSGRDDIPGLEAIYRADLLVISMRRRSLPAVQMDRLERYIRAGKPLIALRTSAAAFQTGQDPQPGYVVWDHFDREVLGCNYQGYNQKSRATGCDVWIATDASAHPILEGVESKFHSPSWIYRQRPLAPTARVLLMGRWSSEDPDEPVAWTNTYQGGRVFYTTLGHPGDFLNQSFQRLLLNAIHWAIGHEE